MPPTREDVPLTETQRKPVSWKNPWVLGIGGVVITGLVWAMSLYLIPGIDWVETFYPAGRELLRTGNPYANVKMFVMAPWALLPVAPLTLLPSNVGRAIYLLISFAGFAYAAYKLGARRWAFAAFMASPPVLHCLLNGNNDWLVLLGFVLPPQIGLFLIAIKPQMSMAVGLYWLVEAWRAGGIKEVVRVFGPVTAALVLSVVIYGPWPLRFGNSLGYWWNASLWPLSIPVGLGLLVAAFRHNDVRFAMGASPCLSPYLLLHSWVSALAAVLKLELETVAAVIGLWAAVVLVAMQNG
jgi:hypothetical protein